MEKRRWSRSRSTWTRWLFAAAVVLSAGWITRSVWDYKTLASSPEFARQVAIEGTDEARSGAVLVLLRDSRKNLQALRTIAAAGGKSAQLAQTALEQLHEQSR